MKIKKEDTLESILDKYPKAVSFLQDNGIVCFICGEPAWGTLEEVISKKNLPVDEMVEKLNLFLDLD
jgi:iron-sulfur cluster repair protein YtfE (RIC family)